MRRAALLLVPLFLFACDREPVAPDSSPSMSATSEWIEWEYVYPPEGWNWGPTTCLPGTPDQVAFGTVGIRMHIVTRPDGRFSYGWSNPYVSDDFRLEIAGETWWILHHRLQRHGMEFYDGSEDRPRKFVGHSFMSFQNENTGQIMDDKGMWTIMWDESGQMTYFRLNAWCVVR
jgi:hypothetical protein